MRYLLFLALITAPVLAQEAETAPAMSAPTFAGLSKQLQEASQKFYKDFQEARKADPSIAYDFSKHPQYAFAPRFRELAERQPGTADAVQSLTLLMRIERDEKERKRILDTLLDDRHVVLKEIAGALFNIRYASWADRPAALTRIVEKTPHKDVKGNALLQLGWVLKQSDPAKALEVLKQAQAEYGDVSFRGKRTVADQAAAEIFEVEHLSVSKVAPDIVGESIDGVPMKLSDFRGKVVLLDFWGDW